MAVEQSTKEATYLVLQILGWKLYQRKYEWKNVSGHIPTFLREVGFKLSVLTHHCCFGEEIWTSASRDHPGVRNQERVLFIICTRDLSGSVS